MEDRRLIEMSADILLKKTASLEEIFGPDWKNKCIFPNLKLALEGELDPRMHNIGDNIFYYTLVKKNPDPFPFFMDCKQYGIIGKSGKVFRFDKALSIADPNWTNKTRLLDTPDSISHSNHCSIDYDDRIHKIVSRIPKNLYSLGAFLHEYCHAAYNILIAKDSLALKSFYSAYNDSQLEFLKKVQIILKDERSSWAIALHLIREVGIEIGLDCASLDARKEILEYAKKRLDTYYTRYCVNEKSNVN